MLRQTDNFIGFISGLFGGCIQFLLDANPNYPSNLLQACITALVCGAAGFIGKEIVVAIKRIIFKKNTDEKDY